MPEKMVYKHKIKGKITPKKLSEIMKGAVKKFGFDGIMPVEREINFKRRAKHPDYKELFEKLEKEELIQKFGEYPESKTQIMEFLEKKGMNAWDYWEETEKAKREAMEKFKKIILDQEQDNIHFLAVHKNVFPRYLGTLRRTNEGVEVKFEPHEVARVDSIKKFITEFKKPDSYNEFRFCDNATEPLDWYGQEYDPPAIFIVDPTNHTFQRQSDHLKTYDANPFKIKRIHLLQGYGHIWKEEEIKKLRKKAEEVGIDLHVHDYRGKTYTPNYDAKGRPLKSYAQMDKEIWEKIKKQEQLHDEITSYHYPLFHETDTVTERSDERGVPLKHSHIMYYWQAHNELD